MFMRPVIFTRWKGEGAPGMGKVLPFPTLGRCLHLVGPSKGGFPDGASGKEPTCQHRRHKRCRFHLWIGKIPWRRAWQPTPAFLPGESPWTEEPGRIQSIGSQSQTRLSATHRDPKPWSVGADVWWHRFKNTQEALFVCLRSCLEFWSPLSLGIFYWGWIRRLSIAKTSFLYNWSLHSIQSHPKNHQAF